MEKRKLFVFSVKLDSNRLMFQKYIKNEIMFEKKKMLKNILIGTIDGSYRRLPCYIMTYPGRGGGWVVGRVFGLGWLAYIPIDNIRQKQIPQR